VLYTIATLTAVEHSGAQLLWRSHRNIADAIFFSWGQHFFIVIYLLDDIASLFHPGVLVIIIFQCIFIALSICDELQHLWLPDACRCGHPLNLIGSISGTSSASEMGSYNLSPWYSSCEIYLGLILTPSIF
jgi:hypothetical protein